MAEVKGSTKYAAKHQHGVQVKETGVADVPVSEARMAELEARITALEAKLKSIEITMLTPVTTEKSSERSKKAS